MTYKFRYKRYFFYRAVTVIGHNYNDKTDKMVLYFPDGSIKEIPEWRKCHLKLEVDWVAAQKKYMEDKAGQTIPLKRG
jgi:hypothetical protein